MTPTFTTEALRLVAQAQLLVTNCYSELTTYTALAYSYWARQVFTMHINAKATPINDTQ